MSGKQREFHGLARGEVAVELFSVRTGPKEIQRPDEGGGMAQGVQRNR